MESKEEEFESSYPNCFSFLLLHVSFTNSFVSKIEIVVLVLYTVLGLGP